MSWSLVTPELIGLLFGFGAGSLAYGVLAERRSRLTARRVASFVGPPRAPAAVPGGASRGRLRPGNFRVVFNAAPPSTRLVLVALVVGGIFAGLITGAALAFGLASVAALVLIALESRGHARAQIESQAPSAVQLLASGLRAGFSMPQALALVAQESPEPTASEIRRTAREIELGTSLDEALARLAQRTSPDYALVSTIVSVQHEVGGNLAQALDAVSETLRERFELRQQVSALTAQQRLSSLVLTMLPIGLFLYTLIANRSYLDPLLSSIVGRVMLVIAGGLLVLGWTVMRSVGRVEE